MGYIKEPKGVDLIIPPSKLTQEEAAEIADFIRKYKLKNKEALESVKNASDTLVTLQEKQSEYGKEPWKDDLVMQISDLTKEEAKEVSEFIRNLKAKGKLI